VTTLTRLLQALRPRFAPGGRLAWAVVAAGLAAGPALAAAPTSPVPPLAPGPVLGLGAGAAAWGALFAALAQQGAIAAPFTELRHFPFRHLPVVLPGELRFDPSHGVSLHYPGPPEATLIVDDRGLVLRDARGRTHELPHDPRTAAAGAVLLPVLRFDLPALAGNFQIRAAGDTHAWRLDFEPRDPALTRDLGTITVAGAETTVQRLEFGRVGDQRIEIRVGAVRTGVTFSAAELRRYFR